MEQLNAEQGAAVAHGDGPLLVLAGAGTGKTKTLAARVGRLLADGVQPERICLLTFSRRAAEEMLRRAGTVARPDLAGRVVGGTFHAVGNRLLRRHGRRIGLAPSFSVLDEGDAAELMSLVRHEVCQERSVQRRFPRADTLVAVYSRMVNAQDKLAAVLADAFPAYADQAGDIRAVFEAYTARKREQQTFDFDDLLLYWRVLMTSWPPEAEPLFDYVLVDEYQDTNAVQADIVAAMAPAGRGVTVVGDDAQAIYGFRAATVANILEFETRFPGASVVRLEQNYRSINPVLAVANAVMSEATAGYRKTLWSRREGSQRPVVRSCVDQAVEAEAVCDSILAQRDDGVALGQQAVLFRASHHSAQLELELSRRGVPYRKFGGLRFLEAAHIRDVLGLLRVLDNPWDELAWSRSLRLLDSVGPVVAGRLMQQFGVRRMEAAAHEEDDVPGAELSPLARFLAGPPAPTPPRVDAEELERLRAAWADCADRGAATPAPAPAVQIGRLRQFLQPVIERRYDNAAARVTDLEQLEQAASRFESRRRFLAELTLDPPAYTSDLAGPPVLDDEYITLSTVHSAKGGEWDVVHLIGASDGMLPSDMALRDRDGLEEERRLMYVALTRARNVLEVSYPMRFYTRPNGLDDNYGYGQPSRFLTGGVAALVERQHAGRSELDDGAGDGADGAAGELGATGRGDAAVDAFLADLLA